MMRREFVRRKASACALPGWRVAPLIFCVVAMVQFLAMSILHDTHMANTPAVLNNEKKKRLVSPVSPTRPLPSCHQCVCGCMRACREQHMTCGLVPLDVRAYTSMIRKHIHACIRTCIWQDVHACIMYKYIHTCICIHMYEYILAGW